MLITFQPSQWPEGQNGVQLTQEAWMNGTPVRADGRTEVEFGKLIIGDKHHTLDEVLAAGQLKINR